MNLHKALFLVLAITLNACSYVTPSDPLKVKGARGDDNKAAIDSRVLDFKTVSDSVLAPKCLSCHRHSHNYLNTEAGILTKKSEIIFEVFEMGTMPPRGPLTACELSILREYLENGSQSDKRVADLDDCNGEVKPQPTASPSPTVTPTPTPEPAQEATATPTSEVSPTATPEASPPPTANP